MSVTPSFIINEANKSEYFFLAGSGMWDLSSQTGTGPMPDPDRSSVCKHWTTTEVPKQAY